MDWPLYLYRFAKIGVAEPLTLGCVRFVQLAYGMLLDDIPIEHREKARDLFRDKTDDAMVSALVEEGFAPEVARIREQLSRTQDVGERARLRVRLSELSNG